MYLTFVTNYMNHHTQPLAEALYAHLGMDFCLIETRPIRQERLDLGWEPPVNRPYLLQAYKNPQTGALCRGIAVESQVLIVGSAPDSWIRPRLRAGKLTFRYAERRYKKPLTWKTRPRAKIGAWIHHGRFRSKPLYLLCASAYAAADAAITGDYLGRTYCWGYFPAVRPTPPKPRRGGEPKLLWVGRMLPLKHPVDAIVLAGHLKAKGYDFALEMIGTGPELGRCQALARQYGLGERVRFLGAMRPQLVRQRMEASDIFLFTSDREEGWGAVLNEAMSSGCAVVASHAPGATPWLIHHGENGLVYPNGHTETLVQQVEYLLDNPQKRVEMGKAAWASMAERWNPWEAAQRLLALTQALLAGEAFPALDTSGPCSPAPLLADDWIWR